MSKHVIIVGGGVAGLSAAHELCERGFRVTIYERWGVPGGKARSTWVPKPDVWPEGFMQPLLGLGRQPSSDPQHRHELPGEHGFRFFAGFYRHIIDTLRRIPDRRSGKSVLDNLESAERNMATTAGTKPIIYLQTLPRNLKDFAVLISATLESGQQLTDQELAFLFRRFWQVATSCHERRLAEYEKIAWWHFLDADAFSPAYQQFTNLSRITVAANPRMAESRTMGSIALQLVNLKFFPPKDRVLNGPTNLVWFNPWVEYLQSRGVELLYNATAVAIQCSDGRIQSITVSRDGQEHQVSGDYYLFCVPVEAMAALLAQDVTYDGGKPVYRNVLAADPSLASIIELAQSVEWMNGIQYYLNIDVSITKGHVMFLDTPWALTAISQRQFWPDFDFASRYDGRVQGILSVDISDWNTPGQFNGKPARICTIQEIAEECWAQMKASLNGPGRELLSDDQVVAYHVDTDISHHSSPSPSNEDAEPLLVNQVDTWALRPGAFTLIPNLFLAADYVRTNTMLATMEAANEAARRAVNAILAAEGRRDYCKVWQLRESLALAPWRMYDRWRYARGLPWNDKPPWFVSAAVWLLLRIYDFWRWLQHFPPRGAQASRSVKR